MSATVTAPRSGPAPVPASQTHASSAHERTRLWLITLALALIWLAVSPPTPDLAAHEYRADVVDLTGLGIWEQGWYAGHHLPGYSVLFPPAGALLTPELVAAICAVTAAWCFERLARGWWPAPAATASATWFAVGVVSTLVGGQLAFAAGLAPALAALLAASRGRTALAATLGAVTTLTSPVVAAFLVLAAAAWTLGARSRAPLAPAAGAVVPGLMIVIAFPQGGTQPFAFSSFAWSLAVAVAIALLLPPRERVLRAGALMYAAALIAAIAIDTPLGGNLVRMAAVFGGPLAIGALWDRRGRALLLLAIPLLYWQWLAPVRSVIRGSGDPSSELAYHQPLLRELARLTRAEGPFRTEVPFTADHWETRYVALRRPLARGWERQLDVKLNPLFYEHGALTPASYRAWLDRLAVRYVALPGVELDPSGEREGALVRSGMVPGLKEVWRGGDWRLFRVAGDRPLARPPARVTQMRLDGLTLTAPRPLTTVVRVRFTPYWRLTGAPGCVSEAPGGWTRVRLDRAGSARLETRFSISRIRAHGPRCSG